jgi:hypothetical protein
MILRSGNRACGLPACKAMRKTLLLVCLCLTACRESDPSTASADLPIAELGRNAGTLDGALGLLERELAAAMKSGGDMKVHLARAEAISDRLLETQLPFTWLQDRAYSVASMLRQIQALADRIVAEQLWGGPVMTQQMLTDLQDLQNKVKTLRTGLQGRGGASPMALDSLLAKYAADSLFKLVDAGE